MAGFWWSTYAASADPQRALSSHAHSYEDLKRPYLVADTNGNRDIDHCLSSAEFIERRNRKALSRSWDTLSKRIEAS